MPLPGFLCLENAFEEFMQPLLLLSRNGHPEDVLEMSCELEGVLDLAFQSLFVADLVPFVEGQNYASAIFKEALCQEEILLKEFAKLRGFNLDGVNYEDASVGQTGTLQGQAGRYLLERVVHARFAADTCRVAQAELSTSVRPPELDRVTRDAREVGNQLLLAS